MPMITSDCSRPVFKEVGGLAGLPVQGESWSICFFGTMEDEYRLAAKIP